MTDIHKLPPGHSLVETEDGSWTLFSEQFQEACHSTTGAFSETLLHYVNGCKITERIALHHPFVILEVGFGLGIGLLATLKSVSGKLHFISLEIDKNLLEWFKEENSQHEILKDLSWDKNILKLKSDQLEISIINGDARTALPEFLNDHPELRWHAIYQDAFSPKRNPRLWTKEWFSLLKNHSDPEVILSTYSASTSIRKSLHETGWGVQKGEKFGPKKTSTRALLNKPSDPEITLQMERSPVPALSDLNIDEFLNKK